MTMLTEANSATTLLDAVNLMLRSIGEAPAVSFLAGGGSVDVESAHATLMEVTRQVQGLGWHFNTAIKLPLEPDPDTGNVRLPQNTLRVDEVRDSPTAYSSGFDVVQRGLRLYDRRKHTFVLSRTVYVDLVQLISFEELPQYARTYITVKAARKFTQDETASDSTSRFTIRDEEEAMAEIERMDNRHADPSLRVHSPFMRHMLRR